MDEKPETTGIIRDKEGKFIKGVSGNPEGRPIGSISITSKIKEELMKVPLGEKVSYLELLINRILKMAIIEKDPQMIKQIWNYIDGMPKQSLDLGLQDTIDSVEIIIKKDESSTDRGQEHNEGVPEKPDGVSEPEEQDNN